MISWSLNHWSFLPIWPLSSITKLCSIKFSLIKFDYFKDKSQSLQWDDVTLNPMYWRLRLKTASHIPKELSASKCTSKWEGSYGISKPHDSGYFLISEHDSEVSLPPLNAKWLKLYILKLKWEVLFIKPLVVWEIIIEKIHKKKET